MSSLLQDPVVFGALACAGMVAMALACRVLEGPRRGEDEQCS